MIDEKTLSIHFAVSPKIASSLHMRYARLNTAFSPTEELKIRPFFICFKRDIKAQSVKIETLCTS